MTTAISPELQQQYEALTLGVGWADCSGRTRIEVTGADRANFLHSFCTNDVKRLAPGQGCEALVTNHQGKTIGHIFIACDADCLLLETVAGQAAALVAHFDRFVIGEDIAFRDITAETAEFLLAGAQAAEALRKAIGSEPPIELHSHQSATIGEREMTIRRVDFAGPDSFFLQSSRTDAAAVQAALDTFATACQAEAVEIVRIEAGSPLFGQDISEDNLPQEIGRDARAISFRKGCYLGQETVARIDALGHVNRQLVGVTFAGTTVPQPSCELFLGAKPVGVVTSACYSPRAAAPLALAYVRRMQAAPGTQLDSSLGAAQVVRLPE
jgi:folate-binding protein YgfZ